MHIKMLQYSIKLVTFYIFLHKKRHLSYNYSAFFEKNINFAHIKVKLHLIVMNFPHGNLRLIQ